MGSSNDKIEKEETEQDISQSSTIDSENYLSSSHIDDLNLKESPQEEILKFIVSGYAQMNKRIQDTKKSIKKEQRKARKNKTVPSQQPERFKRKVMPRLIAAIN
ncbi:unnamed protein product [Blepharisma stoltei]|uniref:Uncharacterized protein n=1 Tax=Blepharisma stoltei TaxID=1481888 RepID=A0AAU9K2Y7_9CILI|nr:unnamed protein product [Blepharisma stoltei]